MFIFSHQTAFPIYACCYAIYFSIAEEQSTANLEASNNNANLFASSAQPRGGGFFLKLEPLGYCFGFSVLPWIPPLRGTRLKPQPQGAEKQICPSLASRGDQSPSCHLGPSHVTS